MQDMHETSSHTTYQPEPRLIIITISVGDTGGVIVAYQSIEAEPLIWMLAEIIQVVEAKTWIWILIENIFIGVENTYSNYKKGITASANQVIESKVVPYASTVSSRTEYNTSNIY